jgi:hypothetical protein
MDLDPEIEPSCLIDRLAPTVNKRRRQRRRPLSSVEQEPPRMPSGSFLSLHFWKTR